MGFKEPKGIITNIQRFSVDDGPGIRTTIFLKGCNFTCHWCHNPETISRKAQIQYREQSCVHCGRCVALCEPGAQSMDQEKHILNWERCNQCLKCVGICAYGALSISGEEKGVAEINALALRDRIFYDKSGGGVTLSGGEPLVQPEFSAEILKALKYEGIHTCLDTAGNVPWSSFEMVLPWVDLVLFDIKLVDPEAHRRYTGGDNHLLLENFRRLCEGSNAVWVRTPLIAGINDDEQETAARGRLLAGMENVKKVQLLPYHAYGLGKYRSFGIVNRSGDMKTPTESQMNCIAEYLKISGINVE